MVRRRLVSARITVLSLLALVRAHRRIWAPVILLLNVGLPIRVAAQDAVPPLVQIGGDLVDQKGKPLAGLQTVTFALYKEQSGDAPLWVEVQTVTADAKGHFVALLGATSPGGLPLELFTTGQARWLGMQAAGQQEQPRTFLASVPYALAPLSAISGTAQPVATDTTAGQQVTATTAAPVATQGPVVAALPLASGPPTSPVFTIVTDSTSGLASTVTNNGATVTLNLLKTCASGQLLKWNGTVWGCTADTDVTIDVTGGGLNVLANATSPNIVGGYAGNAVATGAGGATIGGGGESRLNGSALCPPGVNCQAGNRVTQSFGTVGGGENNQAGDAAGASGVRSFATVSGGSSNTASGLYSTVPGGLQNTATGMFSFAAGRNSKANHDGSFVWGDNSTISTFTSTGPNQFLLRASGGVGINTNAPVATLDVRGDLNLQDASNAGVVRFPSTGGLIFRDNVNNQARMVVSGSTGYVGIGTSTPATMLDVAGSITAHQVCIFNDCRSTWPGVSGGSIGGSGTANALARFVDSATLAASSISDDGLTVRIFPVNGGVPTNGFPQNAALWRASVASGNIIGGHPGNDVASGVEGATIAGGGDGLAYNSVTGNHGTVGGGSANTAALWGTVAGGNNNTAGGFATVAGGINNKATGFDSTVAGGNTNSASGVSATVPGGQFNVAAGDFSFAAGYQAQANHVGAFVWNTSASPFASTAQKQFLINAEGGVGIGTNDPKQAVDVVGNVKADGLCIGSDCRTAWPLGSGGGTITGITPDVGLMGGGTTGNVKIGVDFATTQKRVHDNCGPGSAIYAVNGDGTVSCLPVFGPGLAGSGTPNVVPRFVNGTALGPSQIADDGTNVTIGSSGGLRVLANPSSPNLLGGSSGNVIGVNAVGATIGGGGGFSEFNRITGSFGFVGGGAGNQAGDDPFGAVGYYATVAGGHINKASGFASTVPGGAENEAAGYASFAAGLRAKAVTNGAFVWADIGPFDFASTAPNQFLIRASGGVGITQDVTASSYMPAEALDVEGNVKATKFIGDGSLLTNLPSTGGTITGVTATGGLTGGGTSGSVSLGIASGGVTNTMLQNSAITFTAGQGLSGGGAAALGGTSTLSVDFAATQKRLTSSCATGNAIRAVDSNGIVTCEPIPAGLGGSGTPAVVPKFTGGTSLGNSRISDDATNIVLGDATLGSFRVLGNATSPNLIGGAANNSVAAGIAGATIAGGGIAGLVGGNHVDDNFGTVGGGQSNRAGAANATVGGGNGNTASSTSATVAGGSGNIASNAYAAVTGGQQNSASGQFSAVAGGSSNTAGGTNAAIGGGGSNGASGDYSTVPGGSNNVALGAYSFAAGSGAQANHPRTFVWNDGVVPLASTAPNQFLIQAAGGVGIGTNNPMQALDVSGNVKANGLCIGTDCRTAWPSGGGSGTITGVTAGSGLTGGGTSGSVSLGIASGGVTNTMLQNSAATVNAGLGLSGGGTVALGGSTTLAIDTAIVPRLNAFNQFTLPMSVTGAPGSLFGVVMATNTAVNGGSGVFGSTVASDSPFAAGVRGDATALTGYTVGVLGRSSSSGGVGVEGRSQGGTGATVGVAGSTTSSGDTSSGVVGGASSPTGLTYGVYGVSQSASGTGVYGKATGVTGSTFGGSFSSLSDAGTGVYGSSDNTDSGFAGVWGMANSTSAVGGVFENSAGGDLLLARVGSSAKFRVASSGNVTASGTFTGGGADFAESVGVVDGAKAYEPGDVMVVDPTSNRRFALAREAYSPLVAGIYSTKPGLLGSRTSMDAEQTAQEIPMAVVGIVPTKVSAENGPIERGDLLVASSTPGYAMKGTDRSRMLGAVVGKALEPLAEGKGVIEVLVTVR